MRYTAFFMMTFISASEIREYPALPSHAVQGFPACRSSNGTIAECESDDGLRFPYKIALIGFGCHFERPQAGRLVEQERTTVLHRQYSGTQSSGQSSSNLVHATVDG